MRALIVNHSTLNKAFFPFFTKVSPSVTKCHNIFSLLLPLVTKLFCETAVFASGTQNWKHIELENTISPDIFLVTCFFTCKAKTGYIP